MLEQHVDWSAIEACLTQKSSDWKKREEDLQTLIHRLDAGDSHAMDFVSRNSKSIALQLNDLRSALVKLASIVVEKAAAIAGSGSSGATIEKFAESFLRDANLIKALGSANKVINIHAATAFRSLFEHGQVTLAALEGFFTASKESKSISVRERAAEGLFTYLNALGRHSDKKIKTEGIGFLRKATEALCKDASGNVRTAAKKAKEALEKVEDILLGVSTSACMQEEATDAPTRSRSREQEKLLSNTSGHFEKSKTMPISRFDPSKGMEIENDDTQPLRHIDFGCTKRDSKKLRVKGESVLETLENGKKTIREKIDSISKQDLEDFYTNADADEYRRLLLQFASAKNFEMKKLIVKLIEGVKIGRFMGSVLSYAEKERLDKKLNYSFFITRLIQEPLLEFIQFFLCRNNSFALKLLQRRFVVDEFDTLVRESPDFLQSLLTIISANIAENQNENFVKLNVALLENIHASNAVIAQQKHVSFTDAFFAKLEPLNAELHKFLYDQKRRLGEKVVFKPSNNNSNMDNKLSSTLRAPAQLKSENKAPNMRNDEKSLHNSMYSTKPLAPTTNIEEHDTADSRLEALMSKANSQTKKTVLKGILTHLKALQAHKEPFSGEKMLTKTLEVLRCAFDATDLDDELVSLCCKLMDEMHNIFERDKLKCMSIYDALLDLARAQPNFRERVIEHIIGSSLRSKFYGHVLMCIACGESALVLDGLKILSSMLRMGKESLSYIVFRKELNAMLADTTTIMRELFAHNEVTVRKNVVIFVVACHFFIDSTAFQKMVNEFSAEHQKLIEIYIKKCES